MTLSRVPQSLALLAMFALSSASGLAGLPARSAAAPAAPSSPAAGRSARLLAAAPAGTLRIALLPITDVVPFYLAQDQGYFKGRGLNVELVPVASAAERDQLMASQQVDAQLNDLVSTVLFNAERPRIQIVRKARQAFAAAPQFWILVPNNSPIRAAADLRNVAIAISQNSVIEYITQRLLQREGLAAAEIKTTNVPSIPTRLQLLLQGQLEAATLPDPLASLALLRGARSIVDDGRHPELSLSVISVQSHIVRERPDDVRRLLAAYDLAVQDIRSRPDRFRNILIAQSRVPEPLKNKYQFPPFPDPAVPRQDQWDDVVAWALEKGLIRQAVAYTSSVTAAFVK
jgi:NitT/TauT family transport system substrate-binding protein